VPEAPSELGARKALPLGEGTSSGPFSENVEFFDIEINSVF